MTCNTTCLHSISVIFGNVCRTKILVIPKSKIQNSTKNRYLLGLIEEIHRTYNIIINCKAGVKAFVLVLSYRKFDL